MYWRYSAVLGRTRCGSRHCTQRYSAVLCGTLRYSAGLGAVLGGTRQYSGVLGGTPCGTRRYSAGLGTVLGETRGDSVWYSAVLGVVLGCTRRDSARYSIVLNETPCDSDRYSTALRILSCWKGLLVNRNSDTITSHLLFATFDWYSTVL